jgi:hypothetical protein
VGEGVEPSRKQRRRRSLMEEEANAEKRGRKSSPIEEDNRT